MMQTILSLLIVTIAVSYLVWQWVRQIRSAFRGEATSCGGCGKCSAANKTVEKPTGAALIRSSQISMASRGERGSLK